MAMDWRHEAACQGMGSDLFFPVAMPGTPMYDREVAEAKSVCADCPVRSDCLAWALDSGQDYGVWGGVDEVERRALSRRRVRR